MRVVLAYPGHLNTVPMSRFCREALESLGWTVFLCDVGSGGAARRLGDRFAETTNRLLGKSPDNRPLSNHLLRRMIRRHRPDLFLALFGFDVSLESLGWMRKEGVRTACWWLNDPFQLERSLKKARAYDDYFTNAEGCLEAYRARGIGCHFLPTACQPDVHRPVSLAPDQAQYRSEICFAGDWSPLREQILENLAQEFDVKIWGHWKRKVCRRSVLRPRIHDGFSPLRKWPAFAAAPRWF